MRNIRWQLLIAIGGLVLVVGLLVGQAPILQTTIPQPVSGGVYSEALVGTVTRLNPILDTYNQVDRDVDRMIYSGLVRFDQRGLPVEDLALAWSISADGTIYTFAIREDAVWHDSQPVTSDDVIYTFSKFRDDDYPGPDDLKAMWEEINVIRLDDHTLQFQLPEPFSPFLDYLAVGLLPDHLLRGVSAGSLIDHPFNIAPVGTGPFRFDGFVFEDESVIGLDLAAFEDYYGGRPFLDAVELRFFEDSLTALQAYNAGDIMGLGYVDETTLPSVLTNPQLNVHSVRVPQVGLVLLNSKHPEKTFLDDKQVRKALLVAVNREWIIAQAFDGQGIEANGPIFSGSWAYADDIPSLPYDTVVAADMLLNAGWELPIGASPGTDEYVRSKDEQLLAFELIYPNDSRHEQIAIMLQANWAFIGAQVTIRPVTSSAAMESQLKSKEFEAALAELDLSDYPDPDPYPFWHDSQVDTGQNYGGFTDRNISLWLEQARITANVPDRFTLYRNFQHRFQDQVPALLLYYPVFTYAIDTQVLGVSLGPLLDPSDRFQHINTWYLRARRTLEPTPTPGE